ncbi:MAG: hypothetical protein OEZ06_22590 [Myxococcales bacterium]|nr:hypothetical protein [Myxococcales bacterium]
MSDAAGPPAGASGAFRRSLLHRALHAGVRGDDLPSLREAVQLPEDAGERELMAAMMRELAGDQVASVGLGEGADAERVDEDVSRVIDGRGSFLVQLGSASGIDVEALDDLRTLGAVMRAGTLRQRRAAVLRMGEVLAGPQRLPSDRVRSATDVLIHLRKFSLAYELSQVCSGLPGADGRRARAGRKAWERLVEELQGRVLEFWDGALIEEPVAALHGDQRIQLLARTRDLPNLILRHLTAVLGGCDGVSDRQARADLVGALRDAADPRLVPALRALLDESSSDLMIPAARALGRIDDARVHGILRGAFEAEAAPERRLVLAGVLGIAGDRRGLPLVREVLASGDALLLRYALEALSHLGGSEDVQAVSELLDHASEPSLRIAAVEVLGHVGDGRALSALDALDKGLAAGAPSALRAEIEEARAAILARLELLGEEPPARLDAGISLDTTKMAAMVRRKDPAAVRLRARWYQLSAYLWTIVGVAERAVAAFEAAAALRPDWAAPVVAAALANARREQYPQALAHFRRALEIDHRAVEEHAPAIRLLAQSFLRRAEAVERSGRADIAKGLLEEALSLDLRRAPSGLRFALAERLEHLQRAGGDT